MSPHRLGSLPFVMMIVGVLAAVARPASAEDAERLIRHGIELRKAHDDEGARAEFQKAYDQRPTARAAGHLGLAEQALGRWEDAERHVREAIHASDDPWVIKNEATLADALGIIQGHLGRVEVLGDPVGAAVSVNGRSVGELPLPQAVPVSAGEVDVELHAPGYEPAQRTMTIVAGQYQRVVIHLVQEDNTAPVVIPERQDIPAARTEVDAPSIPVVPLRQAAEVPTDGPSTTRTVLKWSAGGLAVAGVAVGVTFTFIQNNSVAAFETYAGCSDENGTAVLADGSTANQSKCQAALDAFRLDTKIAVAGYVGAGVFAVTWLVLQLTEPSAPVVHALTSSICAPSVTGLGLRCALRF